MSVATSNDIQHSHIPEVARPFRLQFEKAQDSWVLLYPEGMVKLNQSAGEILKRCDGERTVDTIVSDLEQSFGAEGLSDDVTAFLKIAVEQSWVTVSTQASA